MRVRWEVTNAAGEPVGEMRGEGGSVSFDATARIKRVCRGVRFDPDDWQQFDPFSDWLCPVVTAADGVERRMGLFTATEVPLRWRNVDAYDPVEPYLMDAGWYLFQPSAEPLGAFLGDRLSRVLERVARQAGVTRVVNQACGERCGQAMAVPPGSSPGEFMEGVASLAGFASPWFDRDGVLRLGPPRALDEVPDVTYEATDVVRRSRVTDQNLLDAPNVFVVRGSDANREPIEAVAEVPSMFPHSVANRGGRRVVKIISEQGLLSSAQARRVASLLASASVESFETVEFTGLPNTLHDGFAVVQLAGVAYREAGWELSLASGGLMRHRLQRAEVDSGTG